VLLPSPEHCHILHNCRTNDEYCAYKQQDCQQSHSILVYPMEKQTKPYEQTNVLLRCACRCLRCLSMLR